MAKQTERSSRPRAMIHDAQQHAYQWHDQAMRAHQGVSELDDEGIKRMFHTAVLNYWTQLKRFRKSSHIQDIWNDSIPGCAERSLAELGELRFETKTVTGGDFDPRTGHIQASREHPRTMTVRESTAVLDQLDQVANALQFDAQAKEERPTAGWVEADAENGVEVPEDAL